jgi:hypothetical protein
MASPGTVIFKLKKPPFLAVFKNFGLSRFYFYVNLPLLHRHWAGIAKVRIKIKTQTNHVGRFKVKSYTEFG